MPESVLGLRAEGLDPDDPEVAATIDLERWELSLWAGGTYAYFCFC